VSALPVLGGKKGAGVGGRVGVGPPQ